MKNECEYTIQGILLEIMNFGGSDDTVAESGENFSLFIM